MGIEVTISYGQSLDGRIATATGDSQWISGPATMKLAHRLRRDNDGILIGIGTLIKDDPLLNCRLVKGVSPLRVIVDSRLRIPIESQVVETANQYASMVITSANTDEPEKRRDLENRGLEVVALTPDDAGKIPVPQILEILEKRGLQKLLVEGGSGMITSFLQSGRVNRMVIVVAPLIIGAGVDSVGDLGIGKLTDALRPVRSKRRNYGSDLVWEIVFD